MTLINCKTLLVEPDALITLGTSAELARPIVAHDRRNPIRLFRGGSQTKSDVDRQEWGDTKHCEFRAFFVY